MKTPRSRLLPLLLLPLCTASAQETAPPVAANRPASAPTMDAAAIRVARERYERQKFGLFVHYVPGLTRDAQGNKPDIDDLARDFDAAQFAQDAADFGVEYVIFTVQHLKAHMLYPSAVNKRWRDDCRAAPAEGAIPEGKSYSDIDVIDRLATELTKRNIDLHLYAHPVDGHDFSPADQESTGWNDCDRTPGDHARWNQFQNELFEELVHRYRGRIKGLWFDGIFQHTGKKPLHDIIDQPRFRQTLLAYDPGLVLVANVAGDRREHPFPEWVAADYRAWEVSRVINGVLGFVSINREAHDRKPLSWPATQNQLAMVVASNWWAVSKTSLVRQTPEQLLSYLVHQASRSTHGGFAVSAGPFPGAAAQQENGNIWEGDFHPTMVRLGQLIAPIGVAIRDTRPGRAYVTKEREWLGQRAWGVSTESPDRRTVYLHVLRPPEGRVLALGPTEDGSEFEPASAQLLATGLPVGLRKLDSGYELALPDGAAWDPVNTVVSVRRRY